MTPDELLVRLNAGPPVCLLDVRSRSEYRAGHVPGAINIPFWQVGARIHTLACRPDDPVVIYCGHGPRARIAGAAMKRRGFTRVEYLQGHMKKWREMNLPVEET